MEKKVKFTTEQVSTAAPGLNETALGIATSSINNQIEIHCALKRSGQSVYSITISAYPHKDLTPDEDMIRSDVFGRCLYTRISFFHPQETPTEGIAQ